MPAVESSAIREIDYDAANRTLFVRFTSGKRYAYLDVPEAVYEAFLAAESKGRFFADEIRDAYSFHRER